MTFLRVEGTEGVGGARPNTWIIQVTMFSLSESHNPFFNIVKSESAPSDVQRVWLGRFGLQIWYCDLQAKGDAASSVPMRGTLTSLDSFPPVIIPLVPILLCAEYHRSFTSEANSILLADKNTMAVSALELANCGNGSNVEPLTVVTLKT